MKKNFNSKDNLLETKARLAQSITIQNQESSIEPAETNYSASIDKNINIDTHRDSKCSVKKNKKKEALIKFSESYGKKNKLQ